MKLDRETPSLLAPYRIDTHQADELYALHLQRRRARLPDADAVLRAACLLYDKAFDQVDQLLHWGLLPCCFTKEPPPSKAFADQLQQLYATRRHALRHR